MRAKKTGREKDAKLIRDSNRATAVGRLMLGQIRNWSEFLEADNTDLLTLPRRQLKAGKNDVQRRINPELKKFCSKNFQGMNTLILSRLFEEIKAHRGFEKPLVEFEKRFAPIQPTVLKNNPAHLTVSITLWGLQFKFPEDMFSKDIRVAINMAGNVQDKLDNFLRKKDKMKDYTDEIRDLIRKLDFVTRSGILACFNLVEAYLNGEAWDFLRTCDVDNLSNKTKKLLDTYSKPILEKLEKYPNKISGTTLWDRNDPEFEKFKDLIKPFRDSLVHSSPFDAPQKWGGYSKLLKVYELNTDILFSTVSLTVNIIKRIFKHIHSEAKNIPDWLRELDLVIKQWDSQKAS